MGGWIFDLTALLDLLPLGTIHLFRVKPGLFLGIFESLCFFSLLHFPSTRFYGLLFFYYSLFLDQRSMILTVHLTFPSPFCLPQCKPTTSRISPCYVRI